MTDTPFDDVTLRQAIISACFDKSHDSVLIVDSQLVIVSANPLSLKRFPGAISKPLDNFVTPDTCADLMELMTLTDLDNCVIRIGLHDGMDLLADVSKSSTYLIIRILSEDIQRLRQSENAERLMFLGRISAQLAHAMSNPLAVIQGRQELILARYGSKDALLERQLNILQNQCLRIGQLLQSLQVVAKSKLSRTVEVDLKLAVVDVIHSLGDKVKDIQVANLIPSDMSFRCDPVLLRVALHNLLVRSLELCQNTSILTLSIEQLESQDTLILSLNGEAFPTELITMMSKASMSEKLPEQSVGYALSIASMLFREISASLIWDKQPKSGAALRIVFPKNQIVQELKPSSLEKKLSIMVIDDHRILRETLMSLLSNDGHDIIGVSSAEDALLILNERSMDVILVDIRLPGMTGDEFVDHIHVAFPELAHKLVIISGEDYQPPAGALFLRKPFTKQQLTNMINTMLTSAADK